MKRLASFEGRSQALFNGQLVIGFAEDREEADEGDRLRKNHILRGGYWTLFLRYIEKGAKELPQQKAAGWKNTGRWTA